jgi:hypothetical protein
MSMSDSSHDRQKDNWLAWAFIIGVTAATAYWKYRQGKKQLNKPAPEDEFVYIPIDSVPVPESVYFKVAMPSGEILTLTFSMEEWSIVVSLIEMTGEPLDKILVDIANDRKSSGSI